MTMSICASHNVRMARIRAFEETVAQAHAAGYLPGLLHLSMGGEAVAVGVICQLGEQDRIYSSHRPHGHFLAAGVDASALIAELAGREAGICRGRGGSMHLMSDRAVMATGVVGGTLPIAVGHALTVPDGAAVVVFFGDGAVQTGVFHETLNLAVLWRVPVLFVCENNDWVGVHGTIGPHEGWQRGRLWRASRHGESGCRWQRFRGGSDGCWLAARGSTPRRGTGAAGVPHRSIGAALRGRSSPGRRAGQ